MFDDYDHVVRVDMSEYGDKHTVSRMVGAPPGYVGYEQGGQLTEAVRRRPYSIVLLDEIEKAHTEVFDVLLQLLDDGRLTDGQGRLIDFKNTVVIMTSNIGSHMLLEALERDGDITEETREKVMDLLKSKYRPELLNRIDDIAVFNPLAENNLSGIAKNVLDDIATFLMTSPAALRRKVSMLSSILRCTTRLPKRHMIQQLVLERLEGGLKNT
jgi:ATP-dependent Clp protease ATP-binding subunit ClpB